MFENWQLQKKLIDETSISIFFFFQNTHKWNFWPIYLKKQEKMARSCDINNLVWEKKKKEWNFSQKFLSKGGIQKNTILSLVQWLKTNFNKFFQKDNKNRWKNGKQKSMFFCYSIVKKNFRFFSKTKTDIYHFSIFAYKKKTHKFNSLGYSFPPLSLGMHLFFFFQIISFVLSKLSPFSIRIVSFIVYFDLTWFWTHGMNRTGS